jgi:hypothetical protein
LGQAGLLGFDLSRGGAALFVFTERSPRSTFGSRRWAAAVIAASTWQRLSAAA